MTGFKAYGGLGRNRMLLQAPAPASSTEEASARTRMPPVLRGVRDYADSRRKDLVSVTWRRITERYLLAVALMAVVIAGGVWLLLTTAQPSAYDGLLGRVGEQQTLAVMAVAEAQYPAAHDMAALPELATRLDGIADRIMAVHEGLTSGTASPARLTAALQAHYFDGPSALDKQVRDVVATIRDIANTARQGSAPSAATVEALRAQVFGPLLAAEHEAVRLHGEAAAAAAADAIWLHKANAGAALLLLLLEALFIFRPLARHVSRLTEQLEKEARTDALTGLLNRRAVTAALSDVMTSGQAVAVIAIDLDHFKEANDAEGHEAGDALLRAAADRLRGAVRPGDIVGRIGGDEFAVFLIGVEEHAAAREIADRISVALHQPVPHKGKSLRLGATLGVAVAPVDADTPEVVMRAADAALVRAKREGRGGIGRASRSDAERLARGTAILRAFDASPAQGPLPGLAVQFQPILSLRGEAGAAGEELAFEALARWTHPALGEISTSELLGLLGPARTARLGRAVRDAALQSLARLRADGLTSARLALNLSAAEVARRDIAVLVEDQVQSVGLSLAAIEIEITEEVLLDRVSDKTLNQLAALRGRGARLVLDDFGTGNSGLAQLLRLPLDAVKLDKRFVQRLGADGRAEEIVRATVSLAHGLGIEVTAEGVETERQAAILRAFGCDNAQGYFYARPMLAEALRNWLQERAMQGGASIVPLRSRRVGA